MIGILGIEERRVRAGVMVEEAWESNQIHLDLI